MLKILIFGAAGKHNLEYFYYKHLNEKSNVKCVICPSYEVYMRHFESNYFNKILYRIGNLSVYNKITNIFRKAIIDEKPDIVWIFKGMEILPQNINWVKEKNIRIINYNPDHPFIFSGRGSGNLNVTNSFGIYDAHITYNLELQKKIENDYNIPTYFLPFGFEIENEVYQNCNSLTEINKLCFIGNPDEVRIEFINQLIERKIPITLFGHNWKRFFKVSECCEIFEPVYLNEFWKELRKYRIQLNIYREHNVGSHNMRSFEIPAIGGIQLAPDTIENRSFFENGKEIFLYKNFEECVQMIDYLLAISFEKANAIRIEARKRSLNSRYSYSDRTDDVLRIFEQILG